MLHMFREIEAEAKQTLRASQGKWGECGDRRPRSAPNSTLVLAFAVGNPIMFSPRRPQKMTNM